MCFIQARSSALKFSSPALPWNDSLYPKKAMMMSGLSWVSHSSGVGIEPVPVWPEPQRSFALERGGWNFSAPGKAQGLERAEWGRKPGVFPSSHILRMKRFFSGCWRWSKVSKELNCIIREPRPLPRRTTRDPFLSSKGVAVAERRASKMKRTTFIARESRGNKRGSNLGDLSLLGF